MEQIDEKEIHIQVDSVYDRYTDETIWYALRKEESQLEELKAQKAGKMLQVIQ